MNYLKKAGMSLLYILLSILILTLFITTFSYFNIINDKIISIFKIAIPIISSLIGGFYVGKRANKCGYIEGLKLGIILSIILILLNVIILDNSFKFKYMLFYLILITASILGSMMGINRKKSA